MNSIIDQDQSYQIELVFLFWVEVSTMVSTSSRKKHT